MAKKNISKIVDGIADVFVRYGQSDGITYFLSERNRHKDLPTLKDIRDEYQLDISDSVIAEIDKK